MISIFFLVKLKMNINWLWKKELFVFWWIDIVLNFFYMFFKYLENKFWNFFVNGK